MKKEKNGLASGQDRNDNGPKCTGELRPIVTIDGMKLAGQVMPKGKFQKIFEPMRQMDLFE
ncbi:MAG: hypothetical protein WB502_01015 [Thermoactinomyces sp.]